MIEKGTYNSTPPTLTDGQKTDLQVDENGSLKIADGASAAAIGSTDDAAWDGVSANATVISLLKAIAINTAAP